jgi:signal transduction histidine kinase
MRTPVAAIEGYLALALNDKIAKIDPKARDYLEKAQASTKHLGQLFQDLLTSAKAEDGRLSNHPQVVEFGNFLEQLVEDLRFGADRKHLALEYMMGSQGSNHSIDASTEGGQRVVQPLFYVFADPDRVREVITNLFDNAVKYTDSGKIIIGLTGNDKVVQFYIKDTGPGIAAEDIPHLFQKFYRVDNSATRTIGGTGLGLFICKKILDLYSGRIWAESTVGSGTTFYINLPRLDSKKALELQKTNAAPNIPV